ncbi:adenosylcobinamide-phosphate synthase CbiB [Parendozoicomonas sp. Alg238-R29]|uniref:adenosylcobinamide-phosphate synthase CbiB n=1 Tax=Parendozoicomonas sp. Alg238-R29 TaxID=2993446 RepID=UPI00248E6AAD|nr:adenosylcobinamide-phosphate synthase CbiB [Parendozoicomonas sp. Alg238-R29]
MTEFLTSFGIQILLAVLLDLLIGEMTRWHPLIGFGNVARRIEAFFYSTETDINPENRFPFGALALLIAVMPCVFIAWLASGIPYTGWWVEVLLLYLAIGGRSLGEHGRYISQPLSRGDLKEAREKTGWIVSRKTDDLSKDQIIRATIESVLENGNDAVFGALFWFAVAGAPGVVLFRLANTLDAMWGYKNDKYLYFGRAAAYLDDILNWIPARLAALTYALQGNWLDGLHCWQTQARNYKSKNGGAVMAAGAGCLGFTLGGKAVYHGEEVESPVLGCGRLPTTYDIERSISLVFCGTCYWVAISLALSIVS